MPKYEVFGPERAHLFTNSVPEGAEIVGAIRRSDECIGGALVKLASGQYAQVNAGALRTLDQDAVKAALEARKQ